MLIGTTNFVLPRFAVMLQLRLCTSRRVRSRRSRIERSPEPGEGFRALAVNAMGAADFLALARLLGATLTTLPPEADSYVNGDHDHGEFNQTSKHFSPVRRRVRQRRCP